jgi:hypothetical protein
MLGSFVDYSQQHFWHKYKVAMAVSVLPLHPMFASTQTLLTSAPPPVSCTAALGSNALLSYLDMPVADCRTHSTVLLEVGGELAAACIEAGDRPAPGLPPSPCVCSAKFELMEV